MLVLNLLRSPLGNMALIPHTASFLRPLFSCHQDADKEIIRQAGACFALLGQLHCPAPHFSQVLSETQAAAKSSSHSVRLAALPFLRLFLFTNQDEADPAALELAAALLKFRLVDPHPDVREQASTTLSALLQFLFRQDVAAWFEYSLTLARTSLGKEHAQEDHSNPSSSSSEKNTASRNARIRKRHGGVLGLCAILLMSPYDMPPLCGDILRRLSEHISDPISVIRISVSRTISEFKRTHVDQLQPNQALSSEAELIKTLFVSDTACYS